MLSRRDFPSADGAHSVQRSRRSRLRLRVLHGWFSHPLLSTARQICRKLKLGGCRSVVEEQESHSVARFWPLSSVHSADSGRLGERPAAVLRFAVVRQLVRSRSSGHDASPDSHPAHGRPHPDHIHSTAARHWARDGRTCVSFAPPLLEPAAGHWIFERDRRAKSDG